MNLKIYENHLDYETYFSLRESVEWNNLCKEQAINAINNSTYSIVIKNDNLPIAMGRIIGDGIYYTIVDIIVKPDYQGKGIGTTIIKKLVEYVKATLPQDGKASIQLISEKGKEQFYVKQGFQLIPNAYCGSAMQKMIYNI